MGGDLRVLIHQNGGIKPAMKGPALVCQNGQIKPTPRGRQGAGLNLHSAAFQRRETGKRRGPIVNICWCFLACWQPIEAVLKRCSAAENGGKCGGLEADEKRPKADELPEREAAAKRLEAAEFPERESGCKAVENYRRTGAGRGQ